MAVGVRRVLGADVGIAVTGVAGPDGAGGPAAGTVCLAVALGDEVTSMRGAAARPS